MSVTVDNGVLRCNECRRAVRDISSAARFLCVHLPCEHSKPHYDPFNDPECPPVAMQYLKDAPFALQHDILCEICAHQKLTKSRSLTSLSKAAEMDSSGVHHQGPSSYAESSSDMRDPLILPRSSGYDDLAINVVDKESAGFPLRRSYSAPPNRLTQASMLAAMQAEILSRDRNRDTNTNIQAIPERKVQHQKQSPSSSVVPIPVVSLESLRQSFLHRKHRIPPSDSSMTSKERSRSDSVTRGSRVAKPVSGNTTPRSTESPKTKSPVGSPKTTKAAGTGNAKKDSISTPSKTAPKTPSKTDASKSSTPVKGKATASNNNASTTPSKANAAASATPNKTASATPNKTASATPNKTGASTKPSTPAKPGTSKTPVKNAVTPKTTTAKSSPSNRPKTAPAGSTKLDDGSESLDVDLINLEDSSPSRPKKKKGTKKSQSGDDDEPEDVRLSETASTASRRSSSSPRRRKKIHPGLVPPIENGTRDWTTVVAPVGRDDFVSLIESLKMELSRQDTAVAERDNQIAVLNKEKEEMNKNLEAYRNSKTKSLNTIMETEIVNIHKALLKMKKDNEKLKRDLCELYGMSDKIVITDDGRTEMGSGFDSWNSNIKSQPQPQPQTPLDTSLDESTKTKKKKSKTKEMPPKRNESLPLDSWNVVKNISTLINGVIIEYETKWQTEREEIINRMEGEKSAIEQELLNRLDMARADFDARIEDMEIEYDEKKKVLDSQLQEDRDALAIQERDLRMSIDERSETLEQEYVDRNAALEARYVELKNVLEAERAQASADIEALKLQCIDDNSKIQAEMQEKMHESEEKRDVELQIKKKELQKNHEELEEQREKQHLAGLKRVEHERKGVEREKRQWSDAYQSWVSWIKAWEERFKDFQGLLNVISTRVQDMEKRDAESVTTISSIKDAATMLTSSKSEAELIIPSQSPPEEPLVPSAAKRPSSLPPSDMMDGVHTIDQPSLHKVPNVTLDELQLHIDTATLHTLLALFTDRTNVLQHFSESLGNAEFMLCTQGSPTTLVSPSLVIPAALSSNALMSNDAAGAESSWNEALNARVALHACLLMQTNQFGEAQRTIGDKWVKYQSLIKNVTKSWDDWLIDVKNHKVQGVPAPIDTNVIPTQPSVLMSTVHAARRTGELVGWTEGWNSATKHFMMDREAYLMLYPVVADAMDNEQLKTQVKLE